MSNAIEGGYETARITAAEQDRAARQQREADALAFLTRTDNLDVAEILGLVEPAPPQRTVRRTVRGEVRPAKSDRPLPNPEDTRES